MADYIDAGKVDKKTERIQFISIILRDVIISVAFLLNFSSPAHGESNKITSSDRIVFSESGKDLTENQKHILPENVSLRGFVLVNGAADIENDLPNEQENAFRNRARLEAKWHNEKKDSSDMLGTAGSDYYVLASAESDYLWFGPENEKSDYDFDLFEGYFYWLKNPFEVTLGKQIVRWGKTDQISPIDNLNPQDLRQFIVPDYEDRKIPNWMARFRFFFEPCTLEGVYIPFFEPANFDYFGTDWSIFDHLKANVTTALLPPAVKQYIGSFYVDQNEPNDSFENGQWGIRLSRTLFRWDVGISYLYAWETVPFYESFPIKNFKLEGSLSLENLIKALSGAVFESDPAIKTTFKRSNILGFEFETTVGDFGIRGEAAYYDNKSFLTNTITSIRKPVIDYVVGVDYFWQSDWYINLQFSHQIIFDHDPDILFFNRDNTALLGEISKEFWNGNFRALIRYQLGLSDYNYYLSPRLICKYIKNLEATLGLNIFNGDPDTLIGYYDANDQVFLELKYYF